MKTILSRLRYWLRSLPQQIWFLPSAMTLGFLMLIILIIGLQYTEFLLAVEERLSFLALSSVDTARTILSTITGGLISLMVFSFSMVMVVLNQATSQFSPRLLPGLISQRQHQFILGFYLGAILYNLSVLARVASPQDGRTLPLVAILLAILFGVAGLVLFIVFIHAISQSVRIDSILNDLHGSTLRSMEQSAKFSATNSENTPPPEDREDWLEISSRQSGYLTSIDTSGLLKFCQEEEVQILFTIHRGAFVLSGQPILQLSKKPNNDDSVENLLTYLHIDISEDITSDYLHGLHQLKEIAVKALSPGINDPETALSAIDFLSSLLQTYLKQRLNYCLLGNDNNPSIWLKPFPLSELLFELFAPLRTYGSADVIVVQKLIYVLRQLMKIEGLPKKESAALEEEIEQIKKDAQQRLLNARDTERILAL